MTECYINSDWISSRSLKSLSIVECYLSHETRIHISAPGLISLQIISPVGAFPLFEDMPGLVTATIMIDDGCGDSRARLRSVMFAMTLLVNVFAITITVVMLRVSGVMAFLMPVMQAACFSMVCQQLLI